jgi:hypothetical protein
MCVFCQHDYFAEETHRLNVFAIQMDQTTEAAARREDFLKAVSIGAAARQWIFRQHPLQWQRQTITNSVYWSTGNISWHASSRVKVSRVCCVWGIKFHVKYMKLCQSGDSWLVNLLFYFLTIYDLCYCSDCNAFISFFQTDCQVLRNH